MEDSSYRVITSSDYCNIINTFTRQVTNEVTYLLWCSKVRTWLAGHAVFPSHDLLPPLYTGPGMPNPLLPYLECRLTLPSAIVTATVAAVADSDEDVLPHAAIAAGISAEDLSFCKMPKNAPAVFSSGYWRLKEVLDGGMGTLIDCLAMTREGHSRRDVWAVARIIAVHAERREVSVEFVPAGVGAAVTYSMDGHALRPIVFVGDAHYREADGHIPELHYCRHVTNLVTGFTRFYPITSQKHEHCRRMVERERALHGVHVRFQRDAVASAAGTLVTINGTAASSEWIEPPASVKPRDLLFKRISVYWHHYDTWYPGLVVAYRPVTAFGTAESGDSGIHDVTYDDDGRRYKEVLSTTPYRVLASDFTAASVMS